MVGFSFRRTFQLGPLRINLSRGGVGVSAGVPGARVSAGPRGVWLSAGRGGLLYRERLGRVIDKFFGSRKVTKK